MRLSDRLKGLKTKVRAALLRVRHRRAAALAAAAVGVLAVGGGLLLFARSDTGTELVDTLRAGVGKEPTLEELKARVKRAPADAGAHARLGRAQFQAGLRSAGLASYDRALQLDRDQADDALLKDLVSCYGKKQQSRAHALLVKHRLTRAERYLDDLAGHPRWIVRTGAVQTLEKLGKVTRDDYLKLWTTDLGAAECKVRQYAVEKLGELGDRRALEGIRAAKKAEDASTGWFEAKCLGGRIGDAEKKILASK